jgi:hypothetical protein
VPVQNSARRITIFPVKIERASAGWTRTVAIIDG